MDAPDESTYAKGRWQNIVDNDRSPPFKMKLMSVEQIEGIAMIKIEDGMCEESAWTIFVFFASCQTKGVLQIQYAKLITSFHKRKWT